MTDRCRTCDAWLWSWNPPHKCPPKWWWIHAGDNHEAEELDPTEVFHTVYAKDGEEAAEKALQVWAQDDGLDAGEHWIYVCKDSGNDWALYSVSAELEWSFSAQEKKQ
jgi:hypothetical protein